MKGLDYPWNSEAKVVYLKKRSIFNQLDMRTHMYLRLQLFQLGEGCCTLRFVPAHARPHRSVGSFHSKNKVKKNEQ